MDDAIVRMITDTLSDAFSVYENAKKMGKQYKAPQIRPRQFVLRGTDGAVMEWPATDFAGKSDDRFCRVIEASDHTQYFRIDKAVPEEDVRALVREDERAALRILRQAEVLRNWCKAREEGVKRAIAEIQRQRARFRETLDAEVTIRKLGGR